MPKKLNLDENQILELNRLGWSQKEIGDRYNCNQRTIFNVLKKHGLTAKRSTTKRYPTIKERLQALVETNQETGCWEFQGHLNRDGYGHIRYNGKTYRAHRLYYEIFVGQIPSGQILRHTCDVRNCVNFSHLLFGNHQQNMIDMVNRNRQAKGEKCHNFKVDESTKAKMIELRSQGLSGPKIANALNVHNRTVYRYIGELFPNPSDVKKLNIQKAVYLKSQGYTSKEIAANLNASVCTVREYLRSINSTSTNTETSPIQPSLFQDS